MAPGSQKKEKGVEEVDPTARLTDDILVDIISRVPYKSTCCCKCVSPRWRDLISHRDHREKMPQSILGFFYQGYNKFRFPKKARYFTNLSRQRYPLVDPSLSFLPNHHSHSLDILDGCNGLLLCRCWKATDPKTLDYVVCNPDTDEWLVVPATESSSKVSVARLGFDPAVSSHFHVFEFIDEEAWGIDEDERNDYCFGRIETLAIYSSKDGAWKYQTVECDPFVLPRNSVSAFLNGILHLADFHNFIVAVDVEGDNWWYIGIPKLPYNDADINDVFPSQGQLYFANSTTGSELSVWVLEDYVTRKWTLKHSVSLLQLFGTEYYSYADDYRVISIHPEHNLIFIVAGDKKILMSYDMDSMQLCFIRQLGSDCGVKLLGYSDNAPFYPHVPLFSLSLADGH
ncbi:unnamed protein product [Triticum turgidum subsp. durum]|uniref:F-box domain-containing protein n=1 Tax=Triticum turgidum subsp. durum TaxID=4567 RepID=A0A9R1S947_TRITD|nr:unnamed protein product [Triticum turgidum subsp. durum]